MACLSVVEVMRAWSFLALAKAPSGHLQCESQSLALCLEDRNKTDSGYRKWRSWIISRKWLFVCLEVYRWDISSKYFFSLGFCCVFHELHLVFYTTVYWCRAQALDLMTHKSRWKENQTKNCCIWMLSLNPTNLLFYSHIKPFQICKKNLGVI